MVKFLGNMSVLAIILVVLIWINEAFAPNLPVSSVSERVPDTASSKQNDMQKLVALLKQPRQGGRAGLSADKEDHTYRVFILSDNTVRLELHDLRIHHPDLVEIFEVDFSEHPVSWKTRNGVPRLGMEEFKKSRDEVLARQQQ